MARRVKRKKALTVSPAADMMERRQIIFPLVGRRKEEGRKDEEERRGGGRRSGSEVKLKCFLVFFHLILWNLTSCCIKERVRVGSDVKFRKNMMAFIIYFDCKGCTSQTLKDPEERVRTGGWEHVWLSALMLNVVVLMQETVSAWCDSAMQAGASSLGTADISKTERLTESMRRKSDLRVIY